MTDQPLGRTAVILVEFYSGGLVAARAVEASAAGYTVVVADNTGVYRGPGRVVQTGGNVGFGGACNAAVASLGSEVDVLVLQNPDAIIDPAGLGVLVDEVRFGSFVAVAPALMADRFRPLGYAVPGRFREVALALADVARARGARLPPKALVVDGGGVGSRPTLGTEAPGRFASGALMVVDRTSYEVVGGFDPRFFLYVEDLDLWTRLARVGRVGFMTGVTAHHLSIPASSGAPATRTLLRWLGREMFAVTQHRSWRPMRLAHRACIRLLQMDRDSVSEGVARYLDTWRHPEVVQQQVRLLMTGADGDRGRR